MGPPMYVNRAIPPCWSLRQALKNEQVKVQPQYFIRGRPWNNSGLNDFSGDLLAKDWLGDIYLHPTTPEIPETPKTLNTNPDP